jgi:hypothetical protein
MNILLGLLKYPPDYAGDGLRLHRMFTRLRESGQVKDVFVISSWDKPEQKQDPEPRRNSYRSSGGVHLKKGNEGLRKVQKDRELLLE